MNEEIKDMYLLNNPNNKDTLRLFCFPYAGGGASVFSNWSKVFPQNIGIYPIQYPGRENRIIEEPIEKMEVLISEIFNSIKKYLVGTDFILFGHSLGTKVIYELTLKIEKELNITPKAIIISAGKAPFYKEKKPIYYLNDEKFINELKRFSGTPEEVLSNKEVMEIFLPMLRADFKIDETYCKKNVEKINVPILGFMGTKDNELTLEELRGWKNVTTKHFSYRMIEGGHMFININQEKVIKSILGYLNL